MTLGAISHRICRGDLAVVSVVLLGGHTRHALESRGGAHPVPVPVVIELGRRLISPTLCEDALEEQAALVVHITDYVVRVRAVCRRALALENEVEVVVVLELLVRVGAERVLHPLNRHPVQDVVVHQGRILRIRRVGDTVLILVVHGDVNHVSVPVPVKVLGVTDAAARGDLA